MAQLERTYWAVTQDAGDFAHNRTHPFEVVKLAANECLKSAPYPWGMGPIREFRILRDGGSVPGLAAPGHPDGVLGVRA
jgi:hypothetical protein